MNVGRLVGGLICLAVAALLAVLNYALPDNETMFMIGDQNVPMLPVAILGVVGIVLLATVRTGARSAAVAEPAAPAEGFLTHTKTQRRGGRWGRTLREIVALDVV